MPAAECGCRGRLPERRPTCLGLLKCGPRSAALSRAFEQADQLLGALFGAVLREGALARSCRHALQLAVLELKCSQDVVAAVGEQDLVARLKEILNSFPAIAQKGSAAGGSLEQTS